MLYTEMTKKALRIAFDAHIDQTDKTGLPYIYHPLHIAEHIGDDEVLISVALLHDVIEDTPITFEDLSAAGISAEVINAVRLLTHDESVPYMDYVRNIKKSGNKVAITVKIADAVHNFETWHLVVQDENAKARIEKYRLALELLNAPEDLSL